MKSQQLMETRSEGHASPSSRGPSMRDIRWEDLDQGKLFYVRVLHVSG